MDLAPQNSGEGTDRHSRESRDKAVLTKPVYGRINDLARVYVVRM